MMIMLVSVKKKKKLKKTVKSKMCQILQHNKDKI